MLGDYSVIVPGDFEILLNTICQEKAMKALPNPYYQMASPTFPPGGVSVLLLVADLMLSFATSKNKLKQNPTILMAYCTFIL